MIQQPTECRICKKSFRDKKRLAEHLDHFIRKYGTQQRRGAHALDKYDLNYLMKYKSEVLMQTSGDEIDDMNQNPDEKMDLEESEDNSNGNLVS